MENQGKSRKPLIIGLIAAVVVLAIVLGLMLTMCDGSEKPGGTTSSGGSTSSSDGSGGSDPAGSSDLYWNVDRGTTRTANSDGTYTVNFVLNGETVSLTVDANLIEKIDKMDVMGLTVSNGKVTEVQTLSEMGFKTLVERAYVESLSNGVVNLKANEDLSGDSSFFLLEDSTLIYDMSGVSGNVGTATTIEVGDAVMAIANEDGEVTHVFVVWRKAESVIVTAHCDHCDKDVEWSSWTSGSTLPTTDGHYFLTCNVTLNDEAKIDTNSSVVLDLKGYTVKQGKAATRIFVLNGDVELSILDTVGTGKLIPVSAGEKESSYFGMIVEMYKDTSVFNLYGGTLDATGCTAKYGVAVNAWQGTFNMYGGTIMNGTSTTGGGGGNIMVYEATMNMYGGTVTGGTAEKTGGTYGGGNIRVGADATLNISGGTISDGTALNAGGNISCMGTLNISGGTISGGTAAKGQSIYAGGTITVSGNAQIDDVYLAADKTITVDKLTEDAKIGVTMVNPGVFTSGAVSKELAACFTSTDDTYKVTRNSDGTLKLELDMSKLGDAVVHCVCGKPSSTGNACADGGHVQRIWTKWEKTDSLPTAEGYYYLSANVTSTASAAISSTAVVIDLNGKTITGSDDTPIFKVSKTGDLTITDTKGGGKIIPGTMNLKEDGKYNYNGTSLIFHKTGENSVLNIYGGTFDASGKQAEYGSVINNWNGTTNIYGGTLIGGFVYGSGGGTIMAYEGTVNIYGGTVKNGKSIDSSNASRGGGNIRVGPNCTLNIYGGTISNGEAALSGGNIRVQGTVNIYGGTVTGGKAGTTGNDICVVDSGVVNVSGTVGEIYYTSGTVTVSGKAKITKLILPAGKTIAVNGLKSGASICVSMTEPGTFTSNAVDSSLLSCFSSDKTGLAVLRNEDGTLKLAVDESKLDNSNYYCICGASKTEGAEHMEGCDGEKHIWEKWTEATKLPSTSGYYYLSNNVTVSAPTSVSTDMNLVIDLNGKTVSCNTDDVIIFKLGGTGKLTITDTVGDTNGDGKDEGTLIPASRTNKEVADGGLNGYGMIVEMGGTSTLNIFGGTWDATGKSSKYGVAINNWAGTVNMYDGYITGGTAYGSGGGNIMVNATFNLYGGTITGGKSVDTANNRGGGNIRITSAGTLNMYGGTVSDGTAAIDGGNIHNTGKLNISGGIVTNGTATGTTTTSTAEDGTVPESTIGGNGQAIYVVNGNVAFSGNAQIGDVYITKGEVSASENAVIENIDNIGGNVTVEGAVQIGNIYLADGKTITIGESGLTVADEETQTTGASIGITMQNPGVISSNAAADGAETCIVVKNEGYKVSFNNAGCLILVVDTTSGDTFSSCICGDPTSTHNPCADAEEPHKLYVWTKWEATDALPTEAGWYYLDADVTLTAAVNLENTGVYLNLNGHTISTTAEDGVIYALDGTDALSITGRGTVAGTIKTDGTAELTVYAGTINAIDNVAGSVVLYGGTITSATVNADFKVSGTVNITLATVNEGAAIVVDEYLNTDSNIGVAYAGTLEEGGVVIVANGNVPNEMKDVFTADSETYIVSIETVDGTAGICLRPADAGIWHCVCGDPTSTGNPCADAGHVSVKWTAWTPTGGNYTDKEYYFYLDADYTADQIVADQALGKTVILNRSYNYTPSTNTVSFYLDLNGHTITSTARLFRLDGSAEYPVTLTISDSSAAGTGALKPSVKDKGVGVWMMQSGATLNIYGGSIDVSGITGNTSKNGTAIYVAKNTTVNMYGGTVVGGSANQGGAIYMEKNSKFTMYDGTIIAGTIKDGGGAVIVGNNSTFTMYNGVIDASGKTGAYGMCVCAYGGTFTMYDGELIGGTATGSGGGCVSTASGGYFYMHGGIARDGSATNTGTDAKFGGGIVNNGANFVMTGGTITGGSVTNGHGAGVNVRPDSTFAISGDAKIIDNNGCNVYIADGMTITIGEGGLAEDASIGVTMVTPGKISTGTAPADVFFSDSADYQATVEADGIYLRSASDIYRCVCGKTEHTGDCNGLDVKWTVWDGTTSITESGNYMLVLSGDATSVTIADAMVLAENANVVIDLAGYTLDADITLSNGSKLSVVDFVGTGKLDGTVTVAEGSNLVIYSGTVAKVEDNGTVTMYSGTVTEANVNGAYVISGDAKIGTAILAEGKTLTVGEDGLTTGENGASVTVQAANASSGLVVVTGASKEEAACITSADEAYAVNYEATGLCLRPAGEVWHCVCGDCTSTGTPCADAGHVSVKWTAWDPKGGKYTDEVYYIYLDKDLTGADIVNDSTFGDTIILGSDTNAVSFYLDLNGHTITTDARAFRLDGSAEYPATLTICDSSAAGTGKLDAKVSDQGVGVWVRQPGATLNLYSGTIDVSRITSNSKKNGAAIYVAKNTTVNMYGGTVIGGAAASGGAVYMTGANAKFNMYNGTIKAGVAATGGAFYITGGATLNMEGGVITGDGSTKNATNGAAIFMQNASTVNMSGDALITKCVAGSKGAIIMHADKADNIPTLNMSDNAQIVGNHSQAAYAGGVHVNVADYAGNIYAVVNVSGNATISGNTNKNGTCNVYLKNGALITIGEGGLTAADEANNVIGAQIGVTMEAVGTFTGNAANASNFTSDSDAYEVVANEDGTLALQAPVVEGEGDADTETENGSEDAAQ